MQRHRGLLILTVLLMCGCLAVPGEAVAQAPNSNKNSSAGETASSRRETPKKGESAALPNQRSMTPEREAAAFTFARLHHPELADLLVQLKKTRPAEYQRALRDLYQASERLARIGERSPERYELALEGWKLESRIRLLAARMTMSDDPALEEELKAALLRRVDIRLQELQQDRDRTAQRLQKIDESIQEIEIDREAAAFKDLQRIKKSLSIQAPNTLKQSKGEARSDLPKEPKRPQSKKEISKPGDASPNGTGGPQPPRKK